MPSSQRYHYPKSRGYSGRISSVVRCFFGGSVRFGSVIRCFFGGSVRFGSVENFDRTTEFFVQKLGRNWAFSAIIFQLFHKILYGFQCQFCHMVNVFCLASSRHLDRCSLGLFREMFKQKNFGMVRFGSVTEIRFGSVR
eukprot:sb/3474389/